MGSTRRLAVVATVGLLAGGCSNGTSSSSDSTPPTTAATESSNTALADWADGLVVDDTGTFAFDVDRYGIPVATSPLSTPFGVVPALTLSADLTAYQSSPDANGITIAVVPAAQGSAGEIIDRWYSDDGVCSGPETSTSADTLFGVADGRVVEGCGTQRDRMRGVFAIDIATRSVTVVVALSVEGAAGDMVLVIPEFMRVRFP